MDTINWITENWGGIMLAVTSTVTAAAAITALTPTPKDDVIVAKVRKALDFAAFNFLNAKNKDAD